MKRLGKIIKNKKVIVIAIIIFLIMIISIFSINRLVKNTTSVKQPEELKSFYWETKSFYVNDDYTYTFNVLITVQEIDGIDTIKYIKDGKEITINGNGKQKVGIDFQALENTDYEFKITPIGGIEKTEIVNVKRKVAGADTYKLVNGVYLNTPFLENFNSKYTRYLSVTNNDTLTPANWIYDEEPKDWYDYNKQKWANIYVESEGVETYYIWVPRYVYKLDQENQRSDVKFVDVYNNYTDAITGEVTTFKELAEQGYELPEAFEFGDGNNLLNNNSTLYTSISGYWISKYQLSELEEFNIDYNMTANTNSIVLNNFKNNVSDKAVKFTYAINGKITNNSNELEDYTFNNLIENGSYIINVTALDEKDSIVGSMTKTIEPTEVNPPELEGFDKDTTFYVYWDENGIEHNEIPISEPAPSSWYNYTYSKWANIVVRNEGLETYYVWIPRYQYKLNQTSQRSDVKFILGTGNDTFNGYEIPEAFWWDKNDNGTEEEGEQLKGYWITKYQLSREESQAIITAELAIGSDHINVKDITGTGLTKEVEVTEIIDGEEQIVKKKVDRTLKYEYYLNGKLLHNGSSSTEHYTYTGLNINTDYTVNIIARDATSNEYVGAITKKVVTKVANDPDLKYFIGNDEKNDDNNQKSLKDRTYYVVYNGEQISRYVPITQSAPDNWYDYSKSRWANIVVTDGNVSGNTITDATSTNYFVWVPRYQYRILQSVNDWSNLDISNARTDVKFMSGTDTNTDSGYEIPEAFWWDKNDDGVEDEGEQLTGYWMSKYQLSN